MALFCPLVFFGTISDEDSASRGLLRWLAGWLAMATVSGRSAASQQANTARLRVGGTCTPLRIHGTKVQRAACLLAREHTSMLAIWRDQLALEKSRQEQQSAGVGDLESRLLSGIKELDSLCVSTLLSNHRPLHTT